MNAFVVILTILNLAAVGFMGWLAFRSTRRVIEVREALEQVRRAQRKLSTLPSDPPNDVTAQDAADVLSGKKPRSSLLSALLVLGLLSASFTAWADEPSWRPTAWACRSTTYDKKGRPVIIPAVCMTPKDAVRTEEQLTKLDSANGALDVCEDKLVEAGEIREETMPRWLKYVLIGGAAVFVASIPIVATVGD